jgi:hypothetical protein
MEGQFPVWSVARAFPLAILLGAAFAAPLFLMQRPDYFEILIN